MNHNHLPSYIPVPTSATPIPPPPLPTSSKPANSTKPLPTLSTFPPSSSSNPSSSSRRFAVPTSAIGTNVSDLLLSSLLPTNLPKPPSSSNSGTTGPKTIGQGVPRPLSTQRDALSLQLMSNNFRRFVTKVGPLFWIQDRIEEVIFWRKPIWTWAWLLAWTLISFNPRLLLYIPLASLLILLLHIQEKSHPLPSIFGSSFHPITSISAGTVRISNAGKPELGASISTSVDNEGNTVPIPVVPPKEAESSVDYYMNLQAIQNTMGWISDAYDQIAPILTHLTSPTLTPLPTSFHVTPSSLIILLLPPALFLPLSPPFVLPWILLPIGILPTLSFHPNIAPRLYSLDRNRTILKMRDQFQDFLFTDRLSDGIGNSLISKVEVWENERLDPSYPSKQPLVGGAYASKHLRAGERVPWVKVFPSASVTGDVRDDKESERLGSIWKSDGGDLLDHNEANYNSSGILALRDGWDWIPTEEWRVDICGLWSDVGSDEDGWVYSDDSWQNPACSPTSELTPSTTPSVTTLPGLSIRRVTRRRRWYRRVYQITKV